MLPTVIHISLSTISPLLAYLTAGLIILSPSITGFSAVMGGMLITRPKHLLIILALILTSGFTSAIVLAQSIYCYFTSFAFGAFLGFIVFALYHRHKK